MFFAVLDEFLLSSVQVWENIFKKSGKSVDIARLSPDLNNKVLNSSPILLHPKSIYSIEMGTMLLKQLNREVVSP